MPGYGVRPAAEGTGLLPWAWAVERLTGSREYWVATVRADGRPHLAAVWGVWLGGAVWFSSSAASAKARDLRADPRCSISTADPHQPVVVDGTARERGSEPDRRRFLELVDAKYAVRYGLDFLDGVQNVCFEVRPDRVIGLDDADFTGSPTRWTFAPGTR
jgi:PPOX class probable F420-dependent enzyme